MRCPNANHSGLMFASWEKSPEGKNVPIWRCKHCDARCGEMNTRERAAFFSVYFKAPVSQRRRIANNFTRPMDEQGEQLKLF